MFGTILDGAGGGFSAEVQSDKRLQTRSVNRTSTQQATFDGYAFNINTGWISSISTNSALLYFYNGDSEEFWIDSIALGFKDGSATDVQSIYFVSNPTGGTLVAAATDADMIENRRIGDANGFSDSTKIYKATASGQTLTGGSDSALFAQNDQGRLFATVDFLIPKGQAVGLRMDVGGSFSGDVYAALIGHKVKQL